MFPFIFDKVKIIGTFVIIILIGIIVKMIIVINEKNSTIDKLVIDNKEIVKHYERRLDIENKYNSTNNLLKGYSNGEDPIYYFNGIINHYSNDKHSLFK